MYQGALLHRAQQLFQRYRERLLRAEEERVEAPGELPLSLQPHSRYKENLGKGPPADNKTEVPPDEDVVPAATILVASNPIAGSIAVASQNQGYREPTGPLETEKQRRQFEERALLVPEEGYENSDDKEFGGAEEADNNEEEDSKDSSEETIGMMVASDNQEVDWLCLKELL